MDLGLGQILSDGVKFHSLGFLTSSLPSLGKTFYALKAS